MSWLLRSANYWIRPLGSLFLLDNAASFGRRSEPSMLPGRRNPKSLRGSVALEPPLSEQDQMEARRSIELVRSRGCTITVRRPDTLGIGYRVGSGSRDSQGTFESRNPNMEYPEAPDETPKWTVLGIGAPIFAPDGTMLCAIAVTGLPVPATHSDIIHISQSVLSAAVAATSRIGT